MESMRYSGAGARFRRAEDSVNEESVGSREVGEAAKSAGTAAVYKTIVIHDIPYAQAAAGSRVQILDLPDNWRNLPA